jgi:hypothetical protein
MVNRLAVALSATAILLATLGVGGSLAANTRDVRLTFGDFSDATGGGRTAVTVTLENAGGQTLNHVAFAGGALATDLLYNPDYQPPNDPSLPDGASYAAIFPDTGCSLTGGTTNAYESLFCDVGQLAAHTPVSYLLVINVPADADEYATWLTASWNEGWSTTGSNADYTFAEGSFTVGASECTTAASSYFLPAELVDLANGGGTCFSQTAKIKSGAALTGSGGFATLGIDPTYAATPCPAEIHGKCYGVTVSASVLGGVTVPGGVQWSVHWTGIKSLSGIIHFGDDYATDDTDYFVIAFTRQNRCSATLIVNCWITAEGSKGNANPLTFDATFITPNNGRSGGYS